MATDCKVTDSKEYEYHSVSALLSTLREQEKAVQDKWGTDTSARLGATVSGSQGGVVFEMNTRICPMCSTLAALHETIAEETRATWATG